MATLLPARSEIPEAEREQMASKRQALSLTMALLTRDYSELDEDDELKPVDQLPADQGVREYVPYPHAIYPYGHRPAVLINDNATEEMKPLFTWPVITLLGIVSGIMGILFYASTIN